MCAGQTGRQPAQLPGLSAAGLRVERGIGNLAGDPDNTLPLPRVSGPNKKYNNVCCADLGIILCAYDEEQLEITLK